MHDTPRTDAAATDGWSGDAVAVPVEVAKELESALRELVACKDIKDRIDANFGKPFSQEFANLAADYECRKPWAWKEARRVLAPDTDHQLSCPICESTDIERHSHPADALAPECQYWYCGGCEHQWGHE